MIDIAPQILKQAAGQDMVAFEKIYRAASGFVYSVALRITHNCADAEEVAQDVFLKIYHNLKNFQFRSAFKTWVYRITVNTAINRYRKSAREEKGRVDYDAVAGSFAGASSAAEAALESDNEVMLSVLLKRLSPEHKACLILREIEGLTYQQLARTLRIPVNTVRSRLRRARQALLEEAGKGLIKDAL